MTVPFAEELLAVLDSPIAMLAFGPLVVAGWLLLVLRATLLVLFGI